MDIHFTKQNYNDQFAILGKSKELHCCVGPSYERLEWYKDGVKFPWHRNEGKDRNIILYRSIETYHQRQPLNCPLFQATTSL